VIVLVRETAMGVRGSAATFGRNRDTFRLCHVKLGKTNTSYVFQPDRDFPRASGRIASWTVLIKKPKKKLKKLD
jgi:hypothetical protein